MSQESYRKLSRKRITRHPVLMECNRLTCIVIAINTVIFAWGIKNQLWWNETQFRLAEITNIAIINFTIAILIRQQRIINMLFWLATRIPTSWPLWIRWGAGKVFHFGGLHSGGNIVGTIWIGLLFFGMFWNYNKNTTNISTITIIVTAIILIFLFLMIGTAISPIRAKFHDLFERTHRFIGWAILVLFWLQTISLNSLRNK